jgi:hypothetical protein
MSAERDRGRTRARNVILRRVKLQPPVRRCPAAGAGTALDRDQKVAVGTTLSDVQGGGASERTRSSVFPVRLCL